MSENIDEKLRDIGMNEGLGYLVINHYGAICLVANNVFFGDIDKSLVLEGDDSQQALELIQNVEDTALKYGLCFRLYKTFVGLRLIETNKLHIPNSKETTDIMDALHCDPAYIALTRKYNNFRVRLTPKPWRTTESFDFSQGPSEVERYLQSNSVKIADYLGSLGQQNWPINPYIAQITNLHDTYCHTGKGLPLA